MLPGLCVNFWRPLSNEAVVAGPRTWRVLFVKGRHEVFFLYSHTHTHFSAWRTVAAYARVPEFTSDPLGPPSVAAGVSSAARPSGHKAFEQAP